jgi:hypothetical protein
MIPVLLGALTVSIASAVMAARLGGALGAGALVGALTGVGITGLCLLYQRETMRSRPEAAIQAFGISMLIKLAVILCGSLVFRYVEPAAARVDYRSFMVAFAAAVVIVLPLGTLDALRVLKQQRAH